jgi:hypothetical protein
MKVFVRSSQHKKPSVYHTSKECQHVTKMATIMELSKTKAEQRGLNLCSRCDPTINPNAGVDKDFSYFMAAKKAGEQAD